MNHSVIFVNNCVTTYWTERLINLVYIMNIRGVSRFFRLHGIKAYINIPARVSRNYDVININYSKPKLPPNIESFKRDLVTMKVMATRFFTHIKESGCAFRYEFQQRYSYREEDVNGHLKYSLTLKDVIDYLCYLVHHCIEENNLLGLEECAEKDCPTLLEAMYNAYLKLSFLERESSFRATERMTKVFGGNKYKR